VFGDNFASATAPGPRWSEHKRAIAKLPGFSPAEVLSVLPQQRHGGRAGQEQYRLCYLCARAAQKKTPRQSKTVSPGGRWEPEKNLEETQRLREEQRRRNCVVNEFTKGSRRARAARGGPGPTTHQRRTEKLCGAETARCAPTKQNHAERDWQFSMAKVLIVYPGGRTL
jgi:hypothetical protein